jgi:hypothetical protein
MSKILLITLILSSVISGALAPTLLFSRSVSPDTVYYAGAPYYPNKAAVTLEFTAEGDTLVVGGKADVMLSIDISESMFLDIRGERMYRFYWARQSALNFIDGLNPDMDRIGIFGWASARDTTLVLADTSDPDKYFQRWYPFSTDYDQAKQFVTSLEDSVFSYMDTVLVGPPFRLVPILHYGLTPLNISIIQGLNYLIAHAQNQGFFIVLTDGWNTDKVNSDTVLNYVEQVYNEHSIRTFAIGFKGGDMAFLSELAARGGGQAFNVMEPEELDSIFNYLAVSVIRTAASQVDPVDHPLVTDVLGPDIHFVQGSDNLNAGNKAATALNVDSSGSFQKVSINIPEVNLEDTIRVTYEIAAVLKQPSSRATLMRTTNLPSHVNNDTANFSRIFYLKSDGEDTLITFKSPDYLYVLSRLESVRLSSQPESHVPLPDTFHLNFTNLAEAVYGPDTLYAVLEVVGSGGSKVFEPVSVNWNFNPPISWDGSTSLNSVQGTSQTIIVRVDSGDVESVVQLDISLPNSGSSFADTVYFKSTYHYIPPGAQPEGRTIILTYDADTSLVAGRPLPFTIVVINGDGDTVVESQYLPQTMTVTASHLAVVDGDTVTVSAAKTIPLAFNGQGIYTGNFTAFAADTNFLYLEILLPVSQITVKDTVMRVTVPADPASIYLIPENEDPQTYAGPDTLIVGGTQNDRIKQNYQALLFDPFGNRVDDPGKLNQLQWSVTGTLNLNDMEYVSVNRDVISYSAVDNIDPAAGSIVVAYGSLNDALQIVIITPIRVSRIVAREWYPDTAVNLNEVKFVLDSVLGVDRISLEADTGFSSPNQAYLSKLAEYGYLPFLDGFLDYIDIVFNPGHSIKLNDLCIHEIMYSAGSANTTVFWKKGDETDYYKLLPADSLIGSAHEQYRIWLVPTFISDSAGSPLFQTAMTPQVTFDNAQVKAANSPRIYIGDTADYQALYETPAPLTLDSAAPVIIGFTLEDNVCNPKSHTIAKIFFSEAVLLPQPEPTTENLEYAFIRINGQDTLLSINDNSVVNVSLPPAGLDEFYSANVRQNYSDLGYQLEVAEAKETLFKQNVTRITINPNPRLAQDTIKDIFGNHHAGRPSRSVVLAQQPGFTPVSCNQFMVTRVDRYRAMGYELVGAGAGQSLLVF